MKRRRKLSPRFVLALFVLFALIAVLALTLRACLLSDNSKDSGNYSLEFSSQPLVVGQTAKASVAGLPEDYNGTISWSSSDSEVIKVDSDGTMTAKKVGEATIAASVNGKNIPATVKVIEMVAVKSITLDQTSATIASGATLQLKATVETDENISPPVTWTSSNTSIARVANDGMVSARDVGSASITATVGNQTAVCVITVEKDPNSAPVQSTEGTEDTTDPADTTGTSTGTIPPSTNASTKNSTGSATTTGTNNSGSTTTVKSIALSQNFAYLDVNQSMTLEAAVSPADATVSWSSNNNSIATVSPAGVVTAKGSGSVVITAKAGDFSASCTIQIDPESADGEATE